MGTKLPIYRIANWDKLYENAQSRKVEKLRWVSMPNHHDGKGFRRLMAMPNGIEIYGAWALIVQVASKCPTRGTLLDADGPLLAEELSLKTGGSQKIFAEALQVLSSKRIAWLLVDSYQTDTTRPDWRGPEWNGSGGNGMEVEGTEGDEIAAAAATNPIPVSLQTNSFLEAWELWMTHRREIRRPYKPTGLKTLLKELAGWGPDRAAAAIKFSLAKGYQGIFEEKTNGRINIARVGPGQQYDPTDDSERTL